MYYCNNCGEEFDAPIREKATFEEHFKVDKLFNTRHEFDLLKCPECESENIEEMRMCDICEEYCREDDLIDTEGLVGGGTGYCCYQCVKDCDIGG